MIRILVAAALSLAVMSSAHAGAKQTHRRPIACAIIMGAGGGGTGWHIAQGPCRDAIGEARGLDRKRDAASDVPAAPRRHGARLLRHSVRPARHRAPGKRFRLVATDSAPFDTDGRMAPQIGVSVRPGSTEAPAARGTTRPSAREAIAAHPAGCPRVAFCGCGAAVRQFGAPIRSLWRAANWLRFPPAAPGPDMAAVRPHHVMVIMAYHGSGMAMVYDANSGGHRTRVHLRSLAGYLVVNPRAGRIASL